MISHGITTIATNVGGNSEITNNRNGFLIESNNKDQLVKAMKTILSNKKFIEEKIFTVKKGFKKILSKRDGKKSHYYIRKSYN